MMHGLLHVFIPYTYSCVQGIVGGFIFNDCIKYTTYLMILVCIDETCMLIARCCYPSYSLCVRKKTPVALPSYFGLLKLQQPSKNIGYEKCSI